MREQGAVVTEADRQAAKREVNDSARGAVAGAVALVIVGLVISKVVTLALPDSIDGAARLPSSSALPVVPCPPLLLVVAGFAKRRAILETAERIAAERQTDLETAPANSRRA